jgi:hypothetical protein
MIWAKLNQEFIGFAWKRLTPHEIDPKVSNGHEFQGVNGLAQLLGTADRRNIPTVYSLIDDDEEGKPRVTAVIRSVASWYDPRRNDPNRSAEWRLYYPAKAGRIQVICSPGDLMIVGLRQDRSLAVMLIKGLTSVETAIRNLIGIGRVPPRGRGNVRTVLTQDVDVGLSAAETLEELNLSFMNVAPVGVKSPLPFPLLDFRQDTAVQRLAESMISRWPNGLGRSKEVVSEIIRHSGINDHQMKEMPDIVLMRWLEMGEASYRIWEKEVFRTFLAPIRTDRLISDLDLAERVSLKWMAFRQSRVSRAGRVMEILLERLFRAHDLQFDWGATILTTRGKKRPDFLFPSKQAYERHGFPKKSLRLLGAKTSLKERWKQILSEGDKVAVKHGVTRDDSITSETFAEMSAEKFFVVIPKPVFDNYEAKPKNLITLGSFIEEVRAIQRRER